MGVEDTLSSYLLVRLLTNTPIAEEHTGVWSTQNDQYPSVVTVTPSSPKLPHIPWDSGFLLQSLAIDHGYSLTRAECSQEVFAL